MLTQPTLQNRWSQTLAPDLPDSNPLPTPHPPASGAQDSRCTWVELCCPLVAAEEALWGSPWWEQKIPFRPRQQNLKSRLSPRKAPHGGTPPRPAGGLGPAIHKSRDQSDPHRPRARVAAFESVCDPEPVIRPSGLQFLLCKSG